MDAELEKLKGETLTKFEVNEAKDEILIETSVGVRYKMFHEQDCCEGVCIDDIEGDVKDLIGTPITQADEVSNEDFVKGYEGKFTGEGYDRRTAEGDFYPESHTWTFYKFATVKGYVTIRWLGESNGYYSESVDFYKENAAGNFSCWED